MLAPVEWFLSTSTTRHCSGPVPFHPTNCLVWVLKLHDCQIQGKVCSPDSSWSNARLLSSPSLIPTTHISPLCPKFAYLPCSPLQHHWDPLPSLCNRAGHYIFALWFVSFFFFSSPNLSCRRLDVYRTSTHGVALVRMENAGLKCAACGSLEIQDAQKSPFWHHRTTFFGLYLLGTKACIDNRKNNMLNTNTSSTCPDNMVNFRPTNSWDPLASLGHPFKFQQVLRLGSVTARHSTSGRQPNFEALNRGLPPIFSRAAITLGIGPHF